MTIPDVFVADREVWDRMAVGERLAEMAVPAKPGSAFQVGEDEVAREIPGVRILVVGLAPVTERVMSAGDRLRLVIKAGIGTDNIDLEAARNRGIRVTRTPGVNLDGVAEYTIGAMIALARQFREMDMRVRKGEWADLRRSRSGLQPDLRGETLGIIGLGGIGQRLASLAGRLGMRVVASDPWLERSGDHDGQVPLLSLQDLLVQSRFVSVNSVLTPETHHLLGEAQLKSMRRDAYLINAARGPIVDTVALARALEEGWIAGAAVDVMEMEPPPPDHPLLSAPNCFFTPHLMGATAGGYQAIGGLVCRQIESFLRGTAFDPAHVVV